MKYRKKPVVIEAIQFNGHNHKDIFDFMDWRNLRDANDGNLEVLTLEGFKPVDPGYWVIKGVKGEFYPCEPEIFSMTYDPVEGQS